MPTRSVLTRVFALSFALWPLAIAGCGGGSGGGGGGAGTTNTPPSFTSAVTASVIENTTGTIYTATATDAQSQPITFSISGGADATKFAITAGGALNFVSVPNFDLAGDADGDNVYQVTLNASDGAASSTLALAVTVTNSNEGIKVRRIGRALSPIAVVSVPGDNRIIVAEAGGRLFTMEAIGSGLISGVNCSNIRSVVVGERTYIGGGANLFILCQTAAGGLRLDNYNFSPEQRAATNRLTVFEIAPSATGISGGGAMAFATDNRTLFVALPDGGGTGDPSGTAQSSGSMLGKVYRVQQNPDPFAGASPNYFTVAQVGSGVHSPYGATIVGDRFVFADRGQAQVEEINSLARNATGVNFGWPFMEGTVTVRAGGPTGLTNPVAEYRRGIGPRLGTGVIGGAVMAGATGTGFGGLGGNYIFGDLNGSIFTFAYDALPSGGTLASSQFERRNEDFTPDADNGIIEQLVAITQDAFGNIYLIDGEGDIFRVARD